MVAAGESDTETSRYPPRGHLVPNYARMCVSKSEGRGSFFGLKASEMSEKISLKGRTH